MELFRLTKRKYQDDLRGTGAFLAGGRWNNMGIYLLYTSSSRSLAIVESLAHLTEVNNIEEYAMLVLYVPDDITRTSYTGKKLVKGWQNNFTYSQTVGDTWAKENRSLILEVPSVIVPKEYNFLVNPLNKEYEKLKLIEIETFSFDSRLKN